MILSLAPELIHIRMYTLYECILYINLYISIFIYIYAHTHTYISIYLYKYIYIYMYIYVYVCMYHIEFAVFTTIWCSMYKVQSVDSRNAEKEKTDSLLL